jgi:hypothetical protein
VGDDFLPGLDDLDPRDIGSLEEEKFAPRRKRVVPKPPKKAGRPRVQTGPTSFGTVGRPPSAEEDPGLWAVRAEILRQDPSGARIAYAIREAFDQAYDGQRTGRWDYSQLMKTEKTHIGTLVEIWLQRELLLTDGADLDFQIAGHDVDAKWSRNLYDWEIPLEMYTTTDQIALLLWGNEYTVRWAAGLLRIQERLLKPAGNQRDRKRHLNDVGKDSILWLYDNKPMIANTLLQLPGDLAWRVAQEKTGQAAVTLLFREARGVLVNRAAVDAAGQQVDPQKRVRDARKALAPEGIVIFGHYSPHPDLAEALGLPRPTLGRFVSARLAPWQPGDQEPAISLDGLRWRVARGGDPPGGVPKLPEQGKTE